MQACPLGVEGAAAGTYQNQTGCTELSTTSGGGNTETERGCAEQGDNLAVFVVVRKMWHP